MKKYKDISASLEKNKEHIASAIKRGRVRINKRQEELADDIGVNVSTISRYESGKTVIPSPYLEEISKACDFDPINYFVEVKNPKERLDSIAANIGYEIGAKEGTAESDDECDIGIGEELFHLEWLSKTANTHPGLIDSKKIDYLVEDTLIEIDKVHERKLNTTIRLLEYWKELTRRDN